MSQTDPNWAMPIGGESRNGPIEFIRFEDIKPSLQGNDFVEGLLITGAMSVIYGESNCGKTFFALDLALHVAEGRSWFGREITRGPVLYLALEGGNGIRNRIVAYRTEKGLHETALPFLLVPQSLNLLDPEGDLVAIIKVAEQIKDEFGTAPVLIIIDTLSRAMAGGNENAPEDMTALVAAGDYLRKETGAHCLWVHHSGKDQARGARGHSSLRAATDTEIEVIADGGARRAEVRKQRDLDGGDVIRFTLKSLELGINHRGKPVTSCIVEPDSESPPRRSDPAKSLTGHNKRAYEVLSNVLAGDGLTGHIGVPAGFLSVADTQWREGFYESAMPGAEQQAKRRAFQRAGERLVELRIVAMSAGRVWLTSDNQPGQESGT